MKSVLIKLHAFLMRTYLRGLRMMSYVCYYPSTRFNCGLVWLRMFAFRIFFFHDLWSKSMKLGKLLFSI